MDDHVQPHHIVTAERTRRAWSIRQAAAFGGISNTTWGEMERGSIELTPRLRRAVADAFDWPDDWPESMTVVGDESVIHRIETLEETVRKLTEVVESLPKGGVR